MIQACSESRRSCPPSCFHQLACCQQLESTHDLFARTLWWGVSPKNLRLAGIRTSCITKTLFGSLQLYWPPHAAHHQLHCFFLFLPPSPCSPQTRQIPWTGAMIRRKKSVLLCNTCCTMLLFKDGAPHFSSAPTSRRPALIAFRAIMPGKRRFSHSRNKVIWTTTSSYSRKSDASAAFGSPLAHRAQLAVFFHHSSCFSQHFKTSSRQRPSNLGSCHSVELQDHKT